MTYGERLFCSYLEELQHEYRKGVRRAFTEPVVLVDARGEPEGGREHSSDFASGALTSAGVIVKVAPRTTVAQEVSALNVKAGAEIAAGPDPQRPFSVVVLSNDGSVEIFNHPEPR